MTSTVNTTQNIPRIIINDNCDNCYECLDVCREQAMKVENGKITIDAEKCAFCEDCVDICEHEAITVRWTND